MDRKVFWALVAYTFALLFLYLLYLLLALFLTPLIWAAVIGIATFPFYEMLCRRFRGRDSAASAVMTLLVLLVVVLPMVGVVALLAGEASDAYRVLESAAQSGRVPGFDAIRIHPSVAPWVERGESLLRSFNVDLRANLLPTAKQAVSSLLGFASGVLKNVFLLLLNLLLTLVILFFIYRDGRRLEEGFWSVIPLPDENKKTLKENLSRVLTAGVFGQERPAVKGVEIGLGFETARRMGSEVHDEIVAAPGNPRTGNVRRGTNRAGGTEGGMTTGEPLVVRVAMKPISTLMRPLGTVDVKTGEEAKATAERSDVTAVPAMGVIAEAMVAFVLAQAWLEKFGGDSLDETRRNVDGYLARIDQRIGG